MIKHVKWYTEKGWVIHPLAGPKDEGTSPGKRPLLRKWQLLEKTPDLGSFTEGCNIGLVCGRVSDVMVIDYDNPFFIKSVMEGEWETSLTSARTTGRGHIFFKYDPALTNQKHHLLGIEILSDKSNVVLPPSVHKEGEQYVWTTAREISWMPPVIKERLLHLFNIEAELKSRLSKCRGCFKNILQKMPDVSGPDGRLFMLAACTDLKALGAKNEHLMMLARALYKEKYNSFRTMEEVNGISIDRTWKCVTLREKLPGFVDCEKCSDKFTVRSEQMKITVPESVNELTIVINRR